MIHWSSGREGHNNYRRDLVIWLVHLIYSAVGFALCYNYVILNYCIRFAVLPCVRLFLNSCIDFNALCTVSILSDRYVGRLVFHNAIHRTRVDFDVF